VVKRFVAFIRHLLCLLCLAYTLIQAWRSIPVAPDEPPGVDDLIDDDLPSSTDGDWF
jgi:hypothetical protein